MSEDKKDFPQEEVKKKIDIRTLSLEEIIDLLLQRKQKAFRAKQIYHWLWRKSATSFEQMTNLPKSLLEILQQDFVIYSLEIAEKQQSNDGTIKCSFKLHDDHLIEGVLIPTDTRVTACISSQVGCSLSCKFCATGYMKRSRNLEAGEIYDQVVQLNTLAKRNYGQAISNIVYMGMGEPLLNFDNVLRSIKLITSPEGLHISSKRITVSTAGVSKMIKKLGDLEVKFNLALSLHAANDEKRNQIMPISKGNSLKTLHEALAHFYTKTRTRLTYEYIVFNNFNDSLEDAKELFSFTQLLPCKVNIIEYNAIPNADFEKTTKDKLTIFSEYLEKRGVTITVRRSRGEDIDAACGQLANKN